MSPFLVGKFRRKDFWILVDDSPPTVLQFRHFFAQRFLSLFSKSDFSKNREFPIEIFISIRILEYDNALRSIRISRKTCIDKIKIKVELSHFHEKK